MIRLAIVALSTAMGLWATSSKLALVGSQHDLTATGTAPVKSTQTDTCIFCHAPHNSLSITPLWDHTMSSATYTPYTSLTYGSTTATPGVSSKLCLSCHDGTVASGLTVAKGTISTTGVMAPSDVLGTNLLTSHPVGMAAVDDGSLAGTLFTNPPATKDPAVKLVAGRTECTTCHDPHTPKNDPVVPMFLTRSNAKGAICLACHEPARVLPNAMAGWTTGAHATATNTTPVTASFGAYGTVAANACSSCHGAHNNAAAPRNLRGLEEATCAPCHSGTNLTPVLANVTGEYTKLYAHPTMTVSGVHDPTEAVPVNNTRHSECADCHNSHATLSVMPAVSLAPLVQPALVGVSGYDTTGLLRPALKEYQVCYKCHADSTNKPATSIYGRTASRYPAGPMPAGYPIQPPIPADQFNLRLKFSGTIGHNVAGTSVVTTTVSSLLPFMLNVNGTSNLSRPQTTSTVLYCTDCHNNNQARASAGTGPNGPHASTFPHLLQFSMLQEAANGFPSTGTGAALCGKCHNLTTIRNERPHNDHNGYGCTSCHDPHGVIGGNPGANRAMQNFDRGLCTKSTTYFGFYYISNNQKGCYVTCHGENHNGRSY